MTAQLICPDVEELGRLALGRLSEVRLDALLGHLDRCPGCVEVLAGLRPEDELVAALRDPASTGTVRGEVEEIASLIERLRGQTPPSVYSGEENRKRVATTPVPECLGDYRILREVGRGGMGVVYEAVQESLDRRVALKVLPAQCLGDPVWLERFRREARAAAGLHHPHIVPVFDIREDEGVYYYTMEFIPGASLDVVLREVQRRRAGERGSATPQTPPHPPKTIPPGSPSTPATRHGDRPASAGQQTLEYLVPAAPGVPGQPPEAAGELGDGLAVLRGADYYRGVARLGVQAAEALDYAHSRGVLHRDIKPSNLLIDASGTLWITDFGLARVEGSADLTLSRAVLGTPRYMAPEQLDGRADRRSDIYSLGVTLYEMLTLRPPFPGNDPDRLREQLRLQEPPRPGKLAPDLPRDLETVVVTATAREPDRRYQTAGELAEDLRRFLEDRPIRARRASAAERLWRWCRRNPALAGLVASVVLLLATVAVTATMVAISTDSRLVAERRIHREKAEQDAREGALHSYRARFSQAQARRFSGRQGQRFESLRELTEATGLARTLSLPEKDIFDLRNVAIACMTLFDVRVAREWAGWPAGTWNADFDGAWERYARLDGKRGSISVRTVVGDREIYRLREIGTRNWLRISPDGQFLAVCGNGAALQVWRLAGEKPEVVVTASSTIFAFSPDSRQLAIGNKDGSIRLHELPSGRPVGRLPAGPVAYSLAFHPRGGQLAIAWGGGAQVRDLKTGKVVVQFSHPNHDWAKVAWHPDGKVLAVSGGDRTIALWDIERRKQVGRLAGHTSEAVHFTFSRAGDVLASSSFDATLRLWDWRAGEQLRSSQHMITALHFGPDDRFLAAGVKGDKLQLLEIAGGQEYRTLVRDPALGKSDFQSCAVSPDNRLLAAGTDDGFGLYDLQSGRALDFLPTKGCVHVWFEASGALLTNCRAGLYRWPVRADPANAGALRVGPAEPLPLAGSDRQVASSRDGSVVASAQYWGALVLRRERGKRRVVRLAPHEDVRFLAIHPEGLLVATGNHSQSVKVWDAATAKLVRELPAEQSARLAWSPDGRRLATNAHGLCLWDTASWDRVARLQTSGWCPMTFSPDGRLVAFETGDGVICLADPEGGQEYARLEDPSQHRAGCLAFSPDCARLVATSNDGRAIHVWDLRAIRRRLAELRLDWDLPPLTPASNERPPPVRARLLAATGDPDGGPGTFEAESLAVVEQRDGESTVQDMWEMGWTNFTRRWSNDRQLYFPGRRKGAYVELAVDVPRAGRHSLAAYFTRGPDYGVVAVSLDGKKVGRPFDGFDPEVSRSARVDLGVVDLPQGLHRLRFTVEDKNPRSTGHCLGIDCLEVRPVK